jgi:hypothetical protein
MTRRPRVTGWPARLSAFIAARRRTPFAWGTNDCCTFAWSAVGVVTGIEPFPELRSHRSAFAATRTMVRHGCQTTVEMMTLALGRPLSSPLFARRGDVVAVDVSRRPTMGVCLGNSCAFVGDGGLVFWPLTVAQIGWSV